MSANRLLVTGSRNWTDADAVRAGLLEARAQFGDDMVLVHGDARGADRIAAGIWSGWGLPTEGHPADWHGPCRGTCRGQHRRNGSCPAAGVYRNAEMVDLGADMCLAFILDRSAGATACALLAGEAGIPVRRFRAVSP